MNQSYKVAISGGLMNVRENFDKGIPMNRNPYMQPIAKIPVQPKSPLGRKSPLRTRESNR